MSRAADRVQNGPGASTCGHPPTSTAVLSKPLSKNITALVLLPCAFYLHDRNIC